VQDGGADRCVLVVDDDSMIRAVVAEALELEGYGVVTATNGAEALDRVRANPPRAVVLDLMMPVMDGWQFLDACRKENLCADIPILVMSAYRHLGEQAPKLRATACIAKPFDLDVLLGAVDRLVKRAA
jgi:two-component system, chemotaxis family, chemotaxis protein CheY